MAIAEANAAEQTQLRAAAEASAAHEAKLRAAAEANAAEEARIAAAARARANAEEEARAKAEAEATLERMKVSIAATKGGATQAQVFQTPEGWRPAVWPFASREEAQLINATLIARGLRTRAVDF